MVRSFFTSYEKDASGATIPEQQLRQLFQNCDTNGDKKLSRAELRVAFRKLGALIPRFRAHEGMSKADGNGDGFIDLGNEEFGGLVKFAFNLGYTLKN